MTTQPEQILEDELIGQLKGIGYNFIPIKDESGLLANLKIQLEKHNGIELKETEFKQVLNQLGKGNIFDRAATLRDRIEYTDEKGQTKTLSLFNINHWCQNEFQVTRQISVKGRFRNRYDVTLLINGLPLVQIELKRRGLEMKEAFNQLNRYQRQSFGSGYGLFNFIQIHVISNGVNTKYFANNPVSKRSFKQTFFWTDQENKRITQLSAFTDTFLEPCHLAKMIAKYIVLNQSSRMLMVLRPYQYYAVEAIIDRVKNSKQFGYVWHTTGSGKTLTSFKAAQILMKLPEVDQVVFVVDRKDLDFQTAKEFNKFKKDSIDGTANTAALVDQLENQDKLVMTTIQKLNTAIRKSRFKQRLQHLREERIVFIFDECHRSQFGKTHSAIKDFFNGCQMFGFTGTPIFAKNAGSNEFGKRTTAMLFDRCLHKYLITDAIRDQNVLKFSVEYIRTVKQKEGVQDINVEDIDRSEVMNAEPRINLIVDHILAQHPRKTHRRKFTALFCVSGIPSLIQYYEAFRSRFDSGEHDLRIATIFSYGTNETDYDTEDERELYPATLMAAEPEPEYGTEHTRDTLERYIAHYNDIFQTNFTTKDQNSFYNYYKDIGARVKARQIDILLVVGMFLTGFDSKSLNTLYVDKNLRYHGLIQAFSRTNRILNDTKSHGNIVCYRNLKARTDEAITLFSNKDAIEEIVLKPLEDYVSLFNDAYAHLLELAPTVDSVNDFPSEDEEYAFVRAFRDLMRLRNTLGTFGSFEVELLDMGEQEFEDYKSKYLDLYDKVKRDRSKEKVSILDDIDFELELIHRDEINVRYILRLLAELSSAPAKDQAKKREAISEALENEVSLRSKRKLIEKFIFQLQPNLSDIDLIAEAFEAFWHKERLAWVEKFSAEEEVNQIKLEKLMGEYLFTERLPNRDELIDLCLEPPSLLQRKATAERLLAGIVEFIEIFLEGMAGVA